MASVNATAIAAVNTAWDARTGAYTPPVSRLTDQTQLTLTANGDGTTKSFNVNHSLSKVPSTVVMTPGNGPSAAKHTVRVDATKVYVDFTVAPVVGTGNVTFTGMAAY
jgi:hypothetical protein